MKGERGGYSRNLKYRIRLRISPETYSLLKKISEKTSLNLSRVVRYFLEDKLDELKDKQNSLRKSTPDAVA